MLINLPFSWADIWITKNKIKTDASLSHRGPFGVFIVIVNLERKKEYSI